MTINIAYYISEVERLFGLVINESRKKGASHGTVLPEDILNILLPGVYDLARQLEKEIYQKVRNHEGESWPYGSNEMNLLAIGIIFSAWAAWVFRAKSEDPIRDPTSRSMAGFVGKYVESMVKNAVTRGTLIGKGNGRPEGKNEYIDIV